MGDGDFWTANLDLRRYQPVTKSHTLVAASLLTMQSGVVGKDIPKYLDYHLGGSNSVRGYDIAKLGTELFGKNQWLNTLEYRFLLMDIREYNLWKLSAPLGLAGVVFADHGAAWNESFKSDHNKFGYGLGIRLLMPAVNMSRLELGFDENGSMAIHFMVFSKMDQQRNRLR